VVSASRYLALRRSGLTFSLRGDVLTVYGPTRARNDARKDAEGIKEFLRLASEPRGKWGKGTAREARAAVVLADIEEEAQWSDAAAEMAGAARRLVQTNGSDKDAALALRRAGKRYIDDHAERHRPLKGRELVDECRKVFSGVLRHGPQD